MVTLVSVVSRSSATDHFNILYVSAPDTTEMLNVMLSLCATCVIICVEISLGMTVYMLF